MFLNSKLNLINLQCINLQTRKDRKTRMKLQAKNHALSTLGYYTAKPDLTNPKRGCLRSHLAVIRKALQEKDKYPYLMVLEDDAKIIRPLTPFPNPPDDWAMLYLGGTVHHNMERYNADWVRMATWTCHAYLLNLTNQALIADILQAENEEKEIDEYLIRNIHYKYRCYMITPMRIIQRDGYSDIEKAQVKYDFMETTLEGFQKPAFEHTFAGNQSLKVDFVPPELLPAVSIITPTYGRRKLFPMAIRNWQLIQYPAEKLEWIIIDDTPSDKMETIEDILPRNDRRIKYVALETQKNERLSVAHKRNIGVKEAKYDYLIHMDDDDYYPEGSVMMRVKMLLQYGEKGVGCVGCSKVGIYDLVENKSSIATDGNLSLSEASMGYTRRFWEKRNFNELEREGEYKSFISGRFDEILDVPYNYVIIACFHRNNFTGMAKRIEKNVLVNKNTGKEMNFYETWDEETRDFVKHLRKCL